MNTSEKNNFEMLSSESIDLSTGVPKGKPVNNALEEAQEKPLSESRFFSFFVGEEFFAIDVSSIREIRREGKVTPVPVSCFALLGLMNLRGAVIPVFDGVVLFDVDSRRSESEDFKVARDQLGEQLNKTIQSVPSQTFVILEHSVKGGRKKQLMAVTVDGINEVFDVADTDVLPPPEQASISAVVGMIRREGDESMIIVVDSYSLVEKAIDPFSS